MRTIRYFLVALAGLSLVFDTGPVWATLNYSSIGATHDESFDTLQATGEGLFWTNNSTLPNWYLYRVQSPSNSTPVAITEYSTGNGTSTNERFYSFGPSTGSTSDRALGAIGSGTLTAFGGTGFLAANAVIGWIAVGVTNTTGSQLTQFTVEYAGEQWRDGGNGPVAQTMVFEYGYGATFGSVATWTAPGGNFNWNSPVATLAPGAVDGNSAGKVPDRGGTIADQAWGNGATLWLRWIERNDLAIDHGLAIDDFSFSASVSAVPEPAALVLGVVAVGLAAAGMAVRRFLCR